MSSGKGFRASCRERLRHGCRYGIKGGVLLRRNTARFVAFNGLLGALALALCALELLIPAIPFLPPGAKLGLSNIVTMYAAGCTGLVPALAIAVLKGLFALFTRGFTSMLMSLSGGLFSTVAAYFLLKNKSLSYVLIGILCALCHNAAQLVVALLLTSSAVLWYIPFLIIFGVVTGFLTGLLLKVVMPFLSKIGPSTGGICK